MKIYILHSVIVDADGQVSFDCQSPYRSLAAAKKEQRRIVSQYQEGWSMRRLDMLEERCGHFVRVAVEEGSEEIQSNIEVFDLELSLDCEFVK